MEDFSIDTDNLEVPLTEVAINKEDKDSKKKTKTVTKPKYKEEELINPLKKERVIVRFLPKASGIWGNDPKHVLAGGISESSKITIVVPVLRSGQYVNILTDSEKAYLENLMGLEPNALSVYRKYDNFWDCTNASGINKVVLQKQDTYLDLSTPEDFIKYKILLANKDRIAPSLQELHDRYKATYQFVLIHEGTETAIAKNNMTATMECYKEFGKIENERDKLALIIEIATGRPVSEKSKLDFLQTQINRIIQSDAKTTLSILKDPLLDIKVTIKKAVAEGIIARRSNFYYLKTANGVTPLCNTGEESTFSVAARYLSAPKQQETLFAIQAKLN